MRAHHRNAVLVGGSLTALTALHLLAAQGARLGPILCPPIDISWIFLFTTAAFFLMPPSDVPLNRPRVLGAALVLGALAWFALNWSGYDSVNAKPRLAGTVHLVSPPAPSSSRAVSLHSLDFDSRRYIHRLAGRRRNVRLQVDGFLHAPQTGRYRFHLSCDDYCIVAIGDQTIRQTGTGSFDLRIEEGRHPFSLYYLQTGGPAFLRWSWDRPGFLELLPLEHFLSNRQNFLRLNSLQQKHFHSMLVLAGHLGCALFAFCLLTRVAGRLWVKPLIGVLTLLGLTGVLSMVRLSELDLPSHFSAVAVAFGLLAWLRLYRHLGIFRDGKKLGAILFVTLALRFLLTNHADGLNGPEYWHWPWRRISAYRLFPAMFAAAGGFFLAQYIQNKRPRRSFALPLCLLMLSTFALQLTAVGMQSPRYRLGRMTDNVLSPIATSYFTDAISFTSLNDWLQAFPESLPSFHNHARNKPPGPILYYVLSQKIFGVTRRAAFIAGLAIGLLAALSILATYFLIKLLTGGNRDVAFFGASFMALCPGLILFFPRLDQVYPILSCGLIGSWYLALQRDQVIHSIGFGLILSLVLFASYSLLVLGSLLALYTILFINDRSPQKVRIAAKHVLVVLGTVATIYFALWYVTGYDAIETFRRCVAIQAVLAERLNRPYPQSILFDLTDFALGSGWLSVVLVCFFISRKMREQREGGVTKVDSEERWATERIDSSLTLSLLFILQILIVALTGLLRTETARVWLFLLPLLVFPIGGELKHWRHPSRLVVYLCLWLLMTSVAQNMTLVW